MNELKDWQKYVFSCFRKEEFYDFSEDEFVSTDLKRFATYKDLWEDVIYRCGPIASATLSLLFKPKVVVEMGVKAGWTSLLLSRLNPDAVIYGVDIAKYIDYTSIPTGIVLQRHKVENFQLYIQNSWEFKLEGKVDFCFIDGDHSEEAVYKDSWRAWGNINNERDWCIAWDDYHPTNQGVVKSVDKFVSEVGYKLQKAWSWYWIGTKKMAEGELSNVQI